MNKEEYILFLRGVLVKIENAINFLEHQDPPRHILAYRKALGVQQKLAELDSEYRDKMFPQLITIRSVISYLLNGRYREAIGQMKKLKEGIVGISLSIINETNNNK
ncbi:MAG: hypothetical protein ACTSSP_03360 [Candidatus Asgardarchaeia archaeon]